MISAIYTSCSKCKRFIASHPLQNAYGVPAQFSFIDGQVVCWQCVSQVVETRGLVPYLKEKGQLASTDKNI
jgi:hypothetical protein